MLRKSISQMKKDLIAGKEKGLSEAFLDRLTIFRESLNQMCIGLKQIAGLNDPIGEILEMKLSPSGIQGRKDESSSE